MSLGNLFIVPHGREALVNLHFIVVLCGREAEPVTAPFRDYLFPLLWREELRAHFLHIFGPRAGPDHDVEVGEEILQEGGDEWPRKDGLIVAIPVHQRAVKIDDYQNWLGVW